MAGCLSSPGFVLALIYKHVRLPIKGRYPYREGRVLCVLFCCLVLRSSYAQDLVILPFNAPTVVVVTSLETEKALAELSTSFVRQGYMLDFGSMDDQQFSTHRREVLIAEDLEYRAQVKHTITLQQTGPLATVHIKTTWNYGALSKPLDATPQELIDYKERYLPIYSNRIRLYIDALVSEFDYTLLAHPLNKKP